MYNNEHLIQLIAEERAASSPIARARTLSTPCLPERLPNIAFLQREAERNAPLAIIRQLRRSASFPGAEEQDQGTLGSANGDHSAASNRARPQLSGQRSSQVPRIQLTPVGWKPPQQFEIFRAVERKDVMFL